MARAREYNAKQNKSEKDKYHMISLMWNLWNKTNEQRDKKRRQTKKHSWLYGKNSWVPEGAVGELGDGD